jgi:cysteine synthase A
MVAAVKGYKLIVTMPEDMSLARRDLLARFGAKVVLTPAIEGMTGAVYAAQELIAKDGHFMAQQFENPANPDIHRRTTAHEIIETTGGEVDAFVAGVGTGGTITGVGEILREKLGDRVLIVAVEPARSPVLQGGRAGITRIQGIGAGFAPGILNREIYDKVVSVEDEESIEMSRRLCREEGLLVGISAGANVVASIKVAAELGAGKRVVTVLCDTGERYLQMEA